MTYKQCTYHGCGAIVRDGHGARCAAHAHDVTSVKRAHHTDKVTGRPVASSRGYTYKWSKVRLSYIKQNPLCVHCLAKGYTTAAQEVDHIVRHKGKGDPEFFNHDNLQSLCKSCHSRKTRRESSEYKSK